MHQTKYRGIITEGRIIDVSSLGASGFPLVKPLRKSVNPFGGDLCFGWLGSLRLYLYKPLGCVSTLGNGCLPERILPCTIIMLMYGKVSQENYVELTAASAIPNKEIKSPQILRY